MPDSAEITMFVCVNCARPGRELTSAGRGRLPEVPDFGLPGEVAQVLVPCTGRLQPEHVLKAFESGSSVVSVVACKDDNCHHAEGSRRCEVRVEYIRSILKEIGLGEGRLLFASLPGSASEDLDLAAGRPARPFPADLLNDQIKDLRSRITEALRSHPPNPLRQFTTEVWSKSAEGEKSARGEDGGDE
jgi:F420-non-reducing hydrogenase iron-sulfur subunit